MTQESITEDTASAFSRIITFYEDLIALKTKYLGKNDEDALFEEISTIYELTLEKYSWWS